MKWNDGIERYLKEKRLDWSEAEKLVRDRNRWRSIVT